MSRHCFLTYAVSRVRFFFYLCFAQSEDVRLELRGGRTVVELDPAEQTRMGLVRYKESEDQGE